MLGAPSTFSTCSDIQANVTPDMQKGERAFVAACICAKSQNFGGSLSSAGVKPRRCQVDDAFQTRKVTRLIRVLESLNADCRIE